MAEGVDQGENNLGFKTADELRSLREEKGNRNPTQLAASETNRLYYKASPIDDTNLEGILRYLDEFTNERESKNRTWIARGLDKYTKCTFPKEEAVEEPKQPSEDPTGGSNESKIRPRLEGDKDMLAMYRQLERGSSKYTYVDDIAVENLLRRRADEAKEKIRIQKYKQYMKQFMKVYKILKGGEMDYVDALKLINTSTVREGYTCGLKDVNEPSTFWQLSRQAYPVKMETFAVNRRRLLKELAKKYGRALVILKGGEDQYIYDSPMRYEFRQESFFLWTFGAIEPNLWGLLDCWTGKAIILKHRKPEDEIENAPSPLSTLKAKYEVDDVFYWEDLEDLINQISPSIILLLDGVNPESGRSLQTATLDIDITIEQDDTVLNDIMSQLRSIKTNFELDLMRYANNVSSLAHRLLMNRITADSYEYQAEALFKFFTHFVGNCHNLSYPPVCASGRNTEDPEYNSNSRLIKCGDLIIFDMGASFYGYVSSIACTVPAGGLFNLEQKTIYNIVLHVRNVALDVIKAGVFWSEVHDHAMRTLLSDLRDTGLLEGDIDEMLHKGVSTVFMPFGIGHFIGLCKFDVGSYVDEMAEPSNSSPHIAQLRTTRALKPGMVLAVQVGCYFNQRQLRRAANTEPTKKHIVKEKISRFFGLGGVYIKDNIAVTHQGYEMLTDVPRTVEDVENWLAGKHTSDFNAKFNLQESVRKDELWLGTKRNPCVNDDVNNRC